MADLWSTFCGCSSANDKNCDSDLVVVTNPSSCMNHFLIICFDLLLLGMLLLNVFYKSPSKSTGRSSFFQRKSRLQLVSAIFNGLLGILCSCLGIWTLKNTITANHTIRPLHQWLLFLFHGLTWLVVSPTVSLWGKHFPKTPVRLLSITAFLFTAIFGILSLISSIINKRVSTNIALDEASFLGAALLLLCTYKGYNSEETDDKGLYTPLNGKTRDIKKDNLTPLAKAGFLNVMSFWWLNPLMKTGSQKTLEEKDMPKLCIGDRAESCYLTFLEQLDKQKRSDSSSQPSVMRTLVMCNLIELLISGFFALIKIITVSSGPLFLKAFIRVAEGNESFTGEGIVLAISLFFFKILESLSQRQWDFRCRLIGIRVRSLLTAAIYKKQFNLSNAAKVTHSAGEIMNYATVDAYRVGELPNWLHQSWTTVLQLLFALIILFQAVGLATFASLAIIIFTVVCNAPLAKLQHQFQSKMMVAQDERLKAISEALVNMKVLKLYAWEIHFKGVIEKLRAVEHIWLKAVNLRRAYNSFLFWSSPLLVSTATFGACYFIGIPLNASNVFTFVATLRLVQDPIRTIPDVIGYIIQAKVAFSRILVFLEAPELESSDVRQEVNKEGLDYNILSESVSLSWEGNLLKPTLRKISLKARLGEKIAICGEVGSGKSTLLAGILGEVPIIEGTLQVYGSIAYVSQSAWIQTGSIRDNILFGSTMDSERYQETLQKCSLVKDLELLPYGDLTEIGERGVNLSGGQKQRIQLARALYQDADIYLLDDPFSAVDAHTASSLFNEFVMDALSMKTVLLVTHQVDFLPTFDSVLLMSDGEIIAAAPYNQLMASSQEFQDLVNAHKETAGSERLAEVTSSTKQIPSIKDIKNNPTNRIPETSENNQLIKKEEREEGDTGLRPYIQYLNQNRGYLLFSIAVIAQCTFVACNVCQNSWMAANVENPNVSTLKLILVYLAIGVIAIVFLLVRSLFTVALGLQSSKSIFSQLLISLFRAPMSFYDSTPLGRVLSRVSVDLSIIDLDIPFNMIFALAATSNFFANMGVLIFVTWQVLFFSIPLVYVALHLQIYNLSSVRLVIEKDLLPLENRENTLKKVSEVLSRFSKQGIPYLDPEEDMKVQSGSYRKAVRRIEALENLFEKHEVAKSPLIEQKLKVLHKKKEITAQIKAIKKSMRSTSALAFKDELKARKRVLRRLGYVTKDDVVELKGKVACEISSADELVLTELMFNGVFKDIKVEEMVSLLSCFVWQEKLQDAQKPREELEMLFTQLQDTARRVAKVQLDSKVQIDVESFVSSFRPDIMEAVYSWAKGSKFYEIMEITQVFEGSLIRGIRRMEEILQQLILAAKSVGEVELEAKFEDAVSKIKRDIVFAASLYL